MYTQSQPTFAPLPKSHFFLTVSHGIGMRTFAIRRVVVYLVACVLPLLAMLGAGATAYIVFHDDVVASLMARQGQMQYAYEDRLDALRGELQSQAVRDVADRASVENRLHELMSRETKLESRAALVASLADMTGLATRQPALPGRAETLGSLASRRPSPLSRTLPALPTLPAEALGYASPLPPTTAAIAKPRPEPSLFVPPRTTESLSAADPVHLPLQTQVSLASAALDTVEQVQVGALLRIGSAARQEAARLQATLEDVGLSPERFRRDTPHDQGGPFVPLPTDRDTPFGKAMMSLQDTFAAAARLRDAVARVPLAAPLPGAPEVTSPFGARVDPFLGRPSLHTGVDLRESFGTAVTATAAGRVVSASTAGGYGNMVEVDHGNGLLTRYAHLEEILVAEGQTIERGGVVGRLGSTGRSTGPHLHYEVRVDNEPVDPLRFLTAGLRLGAPQEQ